jgi:uncharacterized protein YjiS (DUF1127 family)
MLCIEFKSFIYVWPRRILSLPPKGAAAMPTFDTILDFLREFGLRCIGSPHSRHRQLAALQRLDAHLLKDIGLTPEEAKQAIARRRLVTKPEPRHAATMELRRPYPNR